MNYVTLKIVQSLNQVEIPNQVQNDSDTMNELRHPEIFSGSKLSRDFKSSSE